MINVMDYEVFLLSRIREEWLRTGDNTGAVALGLEKTGGVITNAALLFLIVTIAFTLTTLTITKEIGLGMTVALLVDATIIRSLLVPATMRLLGRWNWWLPGRKWTQKRPESSSGNHAGGQKDKILEEFKPKQPESSSKDHTRAPKDRALKGFKHLPL